MGETVTISVRVPVDLADAMRARAEEEDITISQASRRFWRRWLAGEIEAIPPKGEEATEQGESETGD